MSIYKRGETWWIQFTSPTGERIQRSAGTKVRQEAQEFHDRLKAEAWRVKNIGDKPRYTWKEAVTRWLTEQAHKKSLDDDKRLLRWLHNHCAEKCLDEINSKMVSDLIYIRQKEGVANGTINRMLAVLRSILNKAVKEWEWLDKMPKIKSLPEPKIRIRWLTHDEARRLLRELPEHLEAMTRFTLATGLRESNVVNLKWSQLDMNRRCAWIYADEAKGKNDLAIPLNEDALNVIRKQIGRHQEYVFTYEGRPVTGCNNHAWRKALKRARINDFRWHDLRHTWASWHIQNGTPLHILQELGGWSGYDMVKRYAHLSPEHLSEFAGNSSCTTDAKLLLVKGEK
ncbi:MAG: tyrosine-type recombinase/integrase [Methylobacter sp.]